MGLQKIFSLLLIAAVAVSVSACDVSTPSKMNISKIRVKNQMVTETFDATRIDNGAINYFAENFKKNGSGKMTLTVSYLDGDRSLRVQAEKNGAMYKKAFQKRGVSNVSVVTVPIEDKQYADKLVVSYQALVALAPKNCASMPGHSGSDNLEGIDNYKFGCNTKMIMSKMVADPSDLLGKSGKGDIESRRAGATVESYKAGTPNEPIGGFNASSIGTSN